MVECIGDSQIPVAGASSMLLSWTKHPLHAQLMGLFQGFPGLVVSQASSLILRGRVTSEAGLLGGTQSREDDPMMAASTQYPRDASSRQPVGTRVPLQIIQPQHTSPHLGRLGQRCCYRGTTLRRDQDVVRQCGGHRLVGRAGLPSSGISYQQHESATSQPLTQRPVDIARHVYRYALPHCGGSMFGRVDDADQHGARLAGAHQQPGPPRQSAVGQYKAAVLDLQSQLVPLLCSTRVAFLPDGGYRHECGCASNCRADRPLVCDLERSQQDFGQSRIQQARIRSAGVDSPATHLCSFAPLAGIADHAFSRNSTYGLHLGRWVVAKVISEIS